MTLCPIRRSTGPHIDYIDQDVAPGVDGFFQGLKPRIYRREAWAIERISASSP